MSARQRTVAFTNALSGVRTQVPIELPVDQGKCLRLNLIRYNLSRFRGSVPTDVEALMALTPSKSLSENLPTNQVNWFQEPRFWFRWHPFVRIGGTSESEVIPMTHEIPIPEGVDLVGNLHLVVFNINFSLDLNFLVELFYTFEAVAPGVRRQLRVRDREPRS